ncbi:hypothetical protein PG989_016162 [Apiospora arundinis]
MQFTKLFIAIIASASAVHALPAVEERATDADYNGECNGTKCNVWWQDIPCQQGTSTKQSGGGDGKRCLVKNFGPGQKAYAICPGRN